LTVLVATVYLLSAPLSGRAAQPVPNEYRLKAAFLYQFSQFVEWPSTAWRDAAAVQICILRPNPFGQELEAIVRGETLEGRPFAVKEIAAPDALAGCHLLFVGATAPGAGGVLKAARGASILTVGEGERFLDDGGIIALRVVERRVRFDVNASAAQKAGLRISSQLLSLALNVRGGPL
jgi:hypothetical protein